MLRSFFEVFVVVYQPCLYHTRSCIEILPRKCGESVTNSSQRLCYTMNTHPAADRWVFVSIHYGAEFARPRKHKNMSFCSMLVLSLSYSSDRVGGSGGVILNPSSIQQMDIILPCWSDTVFLFIRLKWLVSYYDVEVKRPFSSA